MSRHGEPGPPHGSPSGPPYGSQPGPPYGSQPGPPHGGYPGGQPGEPYDPPSDPWGQGDGDLTAPHPPGGYPYGGPPPYDPAYDPGGFPPPPPAEPGWEPEAGPQWDGPPPAAAPPERRSGALLFVAVGVLVVVVAGAVGYALYLLSGDEGQQIVTETPGPATTPDPTAEPGTNPDPESTQNRIGLNATQAREGDCLVNHGNAADPEIQIVPCDSPESSTVYLVLAKIDTAVEGDDRAAQDVSAQRICSDTEDYTHHYFEVSESLSFVLCMQEQPESPAGDE